MISEYALTRNFADLVEGRGGDLPSLQRLPQRIAQRMARDPCQRQQDRLILMPQAVKRLRHRTAQRQRAGLVEQRLAHFRQPLQRRSVLHQHAPPHQRTAGDDLRRRNRKAKRAGAGDEQHGHRDQQRLMHARARDHPPREGQRGEQMDTGRIVACGPVGDPDIARLALPRFLHQPGDVGDHSVGPGRRNLDRDRPFDIHRPGLDGIASSHTYRRAFPGQESEVDAAFSFNDPAVGGQPFARRDDHAHAGTQRTGRCPLAAATLIQHQRARRRLLEQRRHASPCAPPHHAVEATPRQQEEQQHHRPIEPGMFAAADGFEQAHRRRQQHADADRHVHVGAPLPERSPGGTEEWLARISNRRQGDQRRQPVKHRPRRAFRARPDRHRQQHDVHRREARHSKRAHQRPALCRRDVLTRIGKRLGIEPQRNDRRLQLRRGQCGIMTDRNPLRAHIDARGMDAGRQRQAVFDLRQASRAMDAGHREQAFLCLNRSFLIENRLAGHQSISRSKCSSPPPWRMSKRSCHRPPGKARSLT